MTPVVLAADASLDCASAQRSFSVLTYNVLLPNLADGWWVFKFYQPSTPEELREWPHRKRLLQTTLISAMADIVCLQETTVEGFDDTFGCLDEAGYDHVQHRKSTLRCATFWRRARFSLAADPQHKDRTLLTSLRSTSDPQRCVHVINAHLKAGPEPARRLRQTSDILEQTSKEARKLEGDTTRSAVVFCGDFNSAPEASGVEQLLQSGIVEPGFREANYPDVELTSKPRSQPFGRFDDAYAVAYGAGMAPATLLLPDREASFFDAERGVIRDEIRAAFSRLFRKFSGDSDVMDRRAVDHWITTINRQKERGSEWKKACEIFEKNGAEQLLETDLIAIYESEITEGKPWSVFHDLHACGIAHDSHSNRVFEGRYDQIQYTSNSLSLGSVRALLSDEQYRLVFEHGDTLPNAWHPSDHLPLGAVFDW